MKKEKRKKNWWKEGALKNIPWLGPIATYSLEFKKAWTSEDSKYKK